MATDALARANRTSIPISKGEPILSTEGREISLLVAADNLSLTYADRAADEQVAGPHIHHEHTDAFYVLEGELTFEIGAGRETITVSAGTLLAAPPGLAHALRTGSGHPARWLTIHAPDGGFATFMRGIRDGVEIDWDIAPVPADGGLPADHVTVSPPLQRPTGPSSHRAVR